MMNKSQTSYDTLKKATLGDPDAIKSILQDYQGYLYTLSTNQYYDQYGGLYLQHDPQMLDDLKIKAIASILRFKIL